MTSLWPARNLVPECRTRSAPSARACWFTGVEKVESMQTTAPWAWHSRATSGTSTHRRYGFVGLSLKNRAVWCSCRAASSAPRSPGSITVAVTPIFGITVWMNCRVRR